MLKQLQRNFAAVCSDGTRAFLFGGKSNQYLNDIIDISLYPPYSQRTLQPRDPGVAPMPTPRYGARCEPIS